MFNKILYGIKIKYKESDKMKEKILLVSVLFTLLLAIPDVALADNIGGSVTVVYDQVSISSPAQYSPTTSTDFEMDWGKDVTNVYLETNITGTLQNITMDTNTTTDISTYSQILGAGTYRYKIYGISSSNETYETDVAYLTIDKANTSIDLYIEGNKNEDYSTIGAKNINITAVMDLNKSFDLYVDDSNVKSDFGKISYIDIFNIGNYVVEAKYSGNDNYTSSIRTQDLTISFSTGLVIASVSIIPVFVGLGILVFIIRRPYDIKTIIENIIIIILLPSVFYIIQTMIS